MSLDSFGSRLFAFSAQSLFDPAEELDMHANEPYSATSLMSFQLNLLSLDAALQQSVSVGPTEPAEAARVEVERLKGLIETYYG